MKLYSYYHYSLLHTMEETKVEKIHKMNFITEKGFLRLNSLYAIGKGCWLILPYKLSKSQIEKIRRFQL